MRNVGGVRVFIGAVVLLVGLINELPADVGVADNLRFDRGDVRECDKRLVLVVVQLSLESKEEPLNETVLGIHQPLDLLSSDPHADPLEDLFLESRPVRKLLFERVGLRVVVNVD